MTTESQFKDDTRTDCDPVVSVIVPCRNVAAYVPDALTCLQMQFGDISDLEVIVVDDGSEDETLSILERMSSKFPRYKVLHNPSSMGLAHVRNQGIENAEGRYLSFLDADDWFASGHLEYLARAADSLECDFLRTDVIQTWGTRRVVKEAPLGVRGRRLVPREYVTPVDRYTMVDHPWSQAGLYHRRLVDRGLLQFPEVSATAEDRPWIWRLHLEAESFAVVDSPGFFWRKDVPNSLTSVYDRRRLGFIPAMGRVKEIVEADPEAERFLPKVLQSVFGLAEHHMKSFPCMEPAIQKELLSGVARLISSFPAQTVASRLERLTPERRQALSGVLESPAGRGRRG